MINKTILHYKILEEIGRGGMGVVYKAQDTQLERTVAIKFLPHQIAADSEERERFKIEAKAAAALNHPNIATIYAIEGATGQDTNEDVFIVMEYIEGHELKKIVTSEQLSVNSVIDFAVQIAEGLSAAHEKGIIHRDIKSTNIMITDQGKVKIMDFGLAKVRGGTQVTKLGTTLGTAAYMSPEQARGEEVDQRSDIWSFGVVLYEMLTGKQPFAGDYEQAVIYSILNEEPRAIMEVRNDPPENLWQIVEKALAKDPDDRYSSTAEILRDIRALTTTVSGKPHALSPLNLMRKPAFIAGALVLIIAFAITLIWWVPHSNNVRRARQTLLPQIEELAEQIAFLGEGEAAWKAFSLANEADKYIPDDPGLMGLWPRVSRIVKVHSKPPNASVYAKPYADSDGSWRYFGQTPSDSMRFPRGFSKVKLELAGYQTVEDLTWTFADSLFYELPKPSGIPDEMTMVTGGSWSLRMPDLDHLKTETINRFLIDRYEVTNKAYKEFVDADGYSRSDYWKYSFIREGREISRAEAMKLFRDKTNRPGPATWEVGDYPEGMDHYPVTGVSWYEAAAYAEFVGKSLPTIFHWNYVAFTWASGIVIPASNLSSSGLAQVGKYPGITRFATYDMAGNAREWVLNLSSKGNRFILGGGWNDPAYAFSDAYTQDAFDRSITNGFRCIRYLDANENQEALMRVIELPFRDFEKERPVSDKTFELLVRQFDYDKTPLNAQIESIDQSNEEWITEKILFDAGYGEDRIIAYLFTPKSTSPPYQTVIYFPGDGGFGTHSSLNPSPPSHFLKSGRAFLRPVYKSTYERSDNLISSMPNESNTYREHVIMWSKDLRRSIDYLETRDDIDIEKLAYYGVSWGGRMAPIMLALEPRFNNAILYVAGLRFQKTQPEADPFNYLPHVGLPVLMLNGKNDFFFPYETSQKPYFEHLGTPENHKKWLVYDGSHTVPRTDLVRESLTWLDHYLGPVSK